MTNLATVKATKDFANFSKNRRSTIKKKSKITFRISSLTKSLLKLPKRASLNSITKRTSTTIKKPTEMKKKFVDTAMQTPKDFTENAQNEDKESWMANEEKNKRTIKSLNKTKEALRQANYFDV